jgi:hypothetical protein
VGVYVVVGKLGFSVCLIVTKVAHEKFGFGCDYIVDCEVFEKYLVRLKLFRFVEVSFADLAVGVAAVIAVKSFQMSLQTFGRRVSFRASRAKKSFWFLVEGRQDL